MAAASVFNLPELQELILLELPVKKLFTIKATCKAWKSAIEQSFRIRRKMSIDQYPLAHSPCDIHLNHLIYKEVHVRCSKDGYTNEPECGLSPLATRVLQFVHSTRSWRKIPKDSSFRKLHFLATDTPHSVVCYSKAPAALVGNRLYHPDTDGILLNEFKVGDILDVLERLGGTKGRTKFRTTMWIRTPR